jgi:general secretion pathway protein L
MIRDFLIWWWQQLVSLLPPGVVGNNTANADAVLMSPVGDVGDGTVEALILSVRKGGALSQLGRFPCDSVGLHKLSRKLAGNGLPSLLLLSLRQGVLLDKTLVLPAAVEPDLDRVLRYEMDVETPFAADDVYWNWTIDGRDRGQGKITVTLALLPRVRLSGLQTLLRQHGIVPQGIVAPRGDGATVLLPLVHDAGKSGGRPIWQHSRVIWGGCLLLALLAIALPFLRQSFALRDLDDRIAAVHASAMEAQRLQSRLDGTSGGGGAILRERRHFADPLHVMAELTVALPDDTFLSDIVVKGHKLTVTGQSSSATRLIGILANNALFRDPSFASPVTRLGPESGTREAFSITAEVRGEP